MCRCDMRNDQKRIETALDFVHNKLSPERRAQFKALMKADEELNELVTIVKDMLDAGKSLRSIEARVSARRLARELFVDFKADADSDNIPHGVRVYDSSCVPRPEGVRPATVEASDLKFRLDEWEVEIALHPVSADSFEIIGRVTGLTRDYAIKVTLRDGKTSITTRADEFLVFRFDRVARGKYRMIIEEKNQTLGILRLEL